ncbi:uncharacterized protein Bfra_003843 [Botrytis fragariae]|uniref:Uncharacterized protein n=1 Tax=Botrytis fragariae TaxID=1964551 RepID=A0A8H6AXL4_9HELO|nr:uncharacterized protein Bfra_003843 [Botrytis fragariae]KAF5875389.1 hypothetical protein Bfra_003843 [Botrytis fragariae]
MERSDRVGRCETQCREQNKKNFVKELWVYGEPDNVYMHLVQVKLVVDISDNIFPFLLPYSYAGGSVVIIIYEWSSNFILISKSFCKINISSCKNILIIASLRSANTNHTIILLGL